MECLPTCASADNPPRHETVTYTEYMLWFGSRNYANIKPKADEKVAEVP